MLQDHLDLRSLREERRRVVDSAGIVHANVEPGHHRHLATIVGAVSVSRFAYRHLRASNLHPADGALNLPTELHSHGLRRLAAIESTRGSFEDVSAAIERSTGVAVAKRQVESLTTAAATDVEDFYAERAPEPDTSSEVRAELQHHLTATLGVEWGRCATGPPRSPASPPSWRRRSPPGGPPSAPPSTPSGVAVVADRVSGVEE